jgi:hypothetical protein
MFKVRQGAILMADPVFKPWRGKNFPDTDSDNFRLLVLGESHYATPDHANSDITNWVVEHHMNGTQREPFFTKWGHLLAGRDPFANAAGQIFDEVAFYNFIQRLVGAMHDDRPTDSDWINAQGPFLTVLDTLRPHAVLVLGMGVWDHIRFPDGSRSEVDGSDRQRLWIRPDGWRIAAAPINHPQSHGFSAVKWQPFVDDLLQRGMRECRSTAR